MRLEQYYKYMQDPRLLNQDSLEGLEELVNSYPYVENLRILYALNLLILDDFKYQDQLHKAAVYSSDRNMLKYWVNYLQQKVEEEDEKADEKQNTKEEASLVEDREIEETYEAEANEEIIEAPPIETKLDPQPKNIDEVPSKLNVNLSKDHDESATKKEMQSSRTKAELLLLVKKRLAEIASEKTKNEEEEGQMEESHDDHSFKANLIDRFIESQPSISRPDKKEFFDPQKEAIDSTLDDDDFFVTETLAHIHVQQGNFKKAIEIYQKLILKIPEKSTYFAAQIRELSRK